MKKSNERLLAMDVARGFSVICMIMVHTLWMYGDKATQSDSWIGTIIHFVGKGTAAFLVLMGISFMISRSQSTTAAIKRGFLVLGAGYLMNTLKFIVPIAVFGTMPDSFVQAYGWEFPLENHQLIYLVKTGDILQMAGISLIVMALIRHMTQQKYLVLMLALVVAFASKELSGLRLGIIGVDDVLDLLWGNQFNVYFPVFPWMSCILFGMFFGIWYRESNNDKTLMFNQMMRFGIGFISLGGALIAVDFTYHFGDFFHLGPGGAIYLTGLNLFGLWCINKIVSRYSSNILFQCLVYSSKRVTWLYVIQWTIVCWGMGVLRFQSLSAGQVVMLIPVIIFLTYSTQVSIEKSVKWFIHKLSRPEFVTN